MSYRVEFTRRARMDLDRLLRSLSSRSPEAVERLVSDFERALTRIETFPLACGLAFESAAFPEEVRHLLFGRSRRSRYRALFVVRGDRVVILAIRAPGERPIDPAEMGR